MIAAEERNREVFQVFCFSIDHRRLLLRAKSRQPEQF